MPAAPVFDAGTFRPALGAAAAARDPWGEIRRFLETHGYNRTEPRWGGAGFNCKFRVRRGRSVAVFDAFVSTLLDGELQGVNIETTTTKPASVDPTNSMSHAVKMQFDRKEVRSCTGEIRYISKKPSQGVVSGTDALAIAIAIGRRFGCGTLELYDASSLPCEGKAIGLRAARILSRGAGWYESKGFRSLIEALEPNKYAKTVARLHTIPVDDLVASLSSIDRAVRSALCASSSAADGSSRFGRMAIAKYDMSSSTPKVVSGADLSTTDVFSAMQSSSVALEELVRTSAKNKKKNATLGDAMDALLRTNCASAGRMVTALLPYAGGNSSDAFVVVTRGPSGDPVAPLPMLEAWVFAWRLLKSYGDLRLTL